MAYSQEKKNCQNCHQEFVIEPEDFEFYAKMSAIGGSALGGKIPAPTWCPECRMIRRMVWRNERALYQESCAKCNQTTLSVYASGHEFPVYCHDCWKSDSWDALEYGQEYDFSKPFFSQFQTLLKKVPRQAIFLIDAPNSQYSNFAAWSKNIYLSYSALNSEDIYYSKIIDKSQIIFDCYDLNASQKCYENNQGERNYNSSFLLNSRDCIESFFLYNCANCQDCFMATNLRNRKFVFRNTQLTKEEYEKKIGEIDFGSFCQIENLKKEFREITAASLHRYANTIKSNETTGDDLQNTNKVRMAFSGHDLENVKFLFRGFGAKDSYDVMNIGPNVELLYEYEGGGAINSSSLIFSTNCLGNSMKMTFTDFCGKSSDLFGCAALKNKKYCILNKEYSEEEYKKLIPRIIKHMDEMPYKDNNGRVYKYGEFFPMELSPFSYNETVAQEYFPITKEKAKEMDYRWKENDKKERKITENSEDLPDNIKNVLDSITQEIISCVHKSKCQHQCTEAFKITSEELAFYQKMNIALPRLCPNCRHYERLEQKNPLKLWHRSCQCGGAKSENGKYLNVTEHSHKDAHCPNKFETSYSPERPETVYCEACYQNEVA